jgi:hypothetical protein
LPFLDASVRAAGTCERDGRRCLQPRDRLVLDLFLSVVDSCGRGAQRGKHLCGEHVHFGLVETPGEDASGGEDGVV